MYTPAIDSKRIERSEGSGDEGVLLLGGLMAFVWWDWGRATRCFGPVFLEHVENSWPIRGGVDLFLITVSSSNTTPLLSGNKEDHVAFTGPDLIVDHR